MEQRDNSRPSATEWDSTPLLHITQNDSKTKIYELFISGILHLVFLDHSEPPVIKLGKQNHRKVGYDVRTAVAAVIVKKKYTTTVAVGTAEAQFLPLRCLRLPCRSGVLHLTGTI